MQSIRACIFRRRYLVSECPRYAGTHLPADLASMISSERRRRTRSWCNDGCQEAITIAARSCRSGTLADLCKQCCPAVAFFDFYLYQSAEAGPEWIVQ